MIINICDINSLYTLDVFKIAIAAIPTSNIAKETNCELISIRITHVNISDFRHVVWMRNR